MRYGIAAVAFDCYGTLVDFGDDSFKDAYGLICAEQGLGVDGRAVAPLPALSSGVAGALRRLLRGAGRQRRPAAGPRASCRAAGPGAGLPGGASGRRGWGGAPARGPREGGGGAAAPRPVAVLSNADDDFLHACLAQNRLSFPVVVSS